MGEDNVYTTITSWDVTAITWNSRTPTSTWEYHHTDYEVEDLKRRVRLLENKLRDTENLCANLQSIVMNLDAMVHEMKDAVWFRYIDIK